jgi:nucleotide-binding universal stress UspA family protein
MLTINTILHPTDFSEHSSYAFELASALARDRGSRLIVLHVAPIPQMQTKRYYREEIEEALRQRQVEDAQVRLEHRLEEGEAVPGILRVAHECQGDLIVMGTLGRTGLGRLLMGSVAEQIVRTAPCPVLTVKVPSADHAAGSEAATGQPATGE